MHIFGFHELDSGGITRQYYHLQGSCVLEKNNPELELVCTFHKPIQIH